MILPIVKYGHPALRSKGRVITDITPEIKQLAGDMLETMHNAHGVGLAAQQVGHDLMLTVVDVTGCDRPSTMKFAGIEVPPEDFMPLYLLNPVLFPGSEKREGVEGCLSFPEIQAKINRAYSLRVQAMDLTGRKIEFECTGLLARAIQHETDHLNGILFIDRMNALDKLKLKLAINGIFKETKAGLKVPAKR